MRTGVFAPLLVVGLIATSPGTVSASTDLKSLLAPPPSADWIESGPGTSDLIGPFTAQSYGAYVDDGSATPGHAGDNLVRDGFVAGYAESWEDAKTGDQLAERVFEFRNSAGANDWYLGVKDESEHLKEHRSDIAAASQIPDSFGVVLAYSNGDQWRLDFRKGNLVFVVHADSFSASEDLSGLATSQALQEYDNAPAGSSTTAGGAAAFPTWLLPVGGGIIGAIFVATAGTILLVWSGARRRRGAPAGAQLSPDGRYWWDGTSWRPTGSA